MIGVWQTAGYTTRKPVGDSPFAVSSGFSRFSWVVTVIAAAWRVGVYQLRLLLLHEEHGIRLDTGTEVANGNGRIP